MPKYVRTCKHCGQNNPNNARRCNGCGQKMIVSGLFSSTNHFHNRWLCPKCSTYNMEENDRCSCGYKLPSYWWIFWLIIIFIGLYLLIA